jgi:hypothetical protein
MRIDDVNSYYRDCKYGSVVAYNVSDGPKHRLRGTHFVIWKLKYCRMTSHCLVSFVSVLQAL